MAGIIYGRSDKCRDIPFFIIASIEDSFILFCFSLPYHKPPTYLSKLSDRINEIYLYLNLQ